jgi:uncharacterized protein (DUF58 family)
VHRTRLALAAAVIGIAAALAAGYAAGGQAGLTDAAAVAAVGVLVVGRGTLGGGKPGLVTATISVPGGRPLDEITAELVPAPRVALVSGAAVQTFLHEGRVTATWVVRPGRWGRYPPGVVLARAGLGGARVLIRAEPDPLEVFPRPARMRPRLVPAELLRRIGEHTGRAVGAGTEFAGLRPYQPGDQLRDVNRAVSIRRGQLHVNQRAATRAADLVIMIDAFGPARGPVADRTLDLAVHGAATLAAAYLRVSDRAGVVVLGGALRWLGSAHGDRQFYRIAELLLQARYDSWVTPDLDRIPRTALSPGTLVVALSPLLDPRGLAALTDLRRRGFPLIVVDTLRDEPPAVPRPAEAGLALRLWRLDRAATRSALRGLGVPVLPWTEDAELDSVLAPLRRPPPTSRSRSTARRPAARS